MKKNNSVHMIKCFFTVNQQHLVSYLAEATDFLSKIQIRTKGFWQAGGGCVHFRMKMALQRIKNGFRINLTPCAC